MIFEQDRIKDFESLEKFKEDEMWHFTRLFQSQHIPVEILIDMDFAYKRFDHPLWLYFQDKYEEESDFNNWVPITVDDVPTIPFEIAKKRKFRIPNTLMNKLTLWIIENKDILKKIADGEIEDIEDAFKNVYIKDEIISSFSTKNYSIHSDAGYNNYKIVYQNETGLFNYIDDNENFISEIWFDVANPFKNIKNKLKAFCIKDETAYLLSPNGDLQEIY